MCWHKWGKWIDYELHSTRFFPVTGKEFAYMDTMQKRYCDKCGVRQDRRVK